MKKFLKDIKNFYCLKNFFSLRISSHFTIDLLIFNILLITVIRWICEFLWIGKLNYFYNILVWFTTLCAFVITFSISTDYLIRKFVGLKYNRSRLLKFFIFSSKLWWLVIPVPILNALFHGKTNVTVKIFSYIPTFMEMNNYLPIGMIIVMPIFIIFTILFIRKTYNLTLIKSVFHTMLGLLIIYVIFYQWSWHLVNYSLYSLEKNPQIDFRKSYLVSISYYIITDLIYLFPFIKPVHRFFNKYPLFIYYLFIIINITIPSIIILSTYIVYLL